jgi:hypothetical protein
MATRRVGMDDPVPGSRQGPPQVVNKHGDPIKLSSYQKNMIYKRAKELKEGMRGKMCTKFETHRTDERTVNKMLHSEFANHDKMREYNQSMKALGAQGKETDLNNYRRRGQ